ncbi:MAG: glycine cleavage system protein GcvH [Treponema sp.]|jgi:glycine cleavage system H protein|nr:glycine cleavage system protein GcvH [Treponema sp.]
MNIPEDLMYTESHEWVKIREDGCMEIGLSDYAQEELGDIVFVNLPKPGASLKKGSAFADVESVKAVSDIISPIDGIVKESNADLQNAPELINQSPYTAWLIRAEGQIPGDLLSAAEYKASLKQE